MIRVREMVNERIAMANAGAARQMAALTQAVDVSIAPIAATMEVDASTSTVVAMDDLKEQIAQLRAQVDTLSSRAARLASGGAAGEVFPSGEIEVF